MKTFQKTVKYCEECPHCKQYDPNKDPYPDVGDWLSQSWCSRKNMHISHQLQHVTIPSWCPLPNN